MPYRHELSALARAKDSDEDYALRATTRLEKSANLAHYLIWALGVFGSGLCAIAVWATMMRVDVAKNKDRIDDIKKIDIPALEARELAVAAKIEANASLIGGIITSEKVKAESDGRVFDSIKSVTERQEETLKMVAQTVKEMEKSVTILDLLRDSGVSNKEDFYKRHGYWPPSLSGGLEEPSPSVKPSR